MISLTHMSRTTHQQIQLTLPSKCQEFNLFSPLTSLLRMLACLYHLLPFPLPSLHRLFSTQQLGFTFFSEWAFKTHQTVSVCYTKPRWFPLHLEENWKSSLWPIEPHMSPSFMSSHSACIVFLTVFWIHQAHSCVRDCELASGPEYHGIFSLTSLSLWNLPHQGVSRLSSSHPT